MFKLDDYDKKIIKEAKDETNTGRDIKTKDDLICLIEELLYVLKNTKEELEELKEDVESNYRPIPLDSVDMYG